MQHVGSVFFFSVILFLTYLSVSHSFPSLSPAGADTIAIRKKLHPSVQILFFSATYSKPILAFARTVVPRAYLVTPRSTEELVLDVIFQVRMDVNKCRGGKLQVILTIFFLFFCISVYGV